MSTRTLPSLLAAALSAWLGASCTSMPPADPPLALAAAREGTEVKIAESDSWSVVDIRCPRGIGWAEFTTPAGQHPRGVLIRLHLRGLEDCVIERGGRKVQLSVSSHGDLTIDQRLEDGQPVPAEERIAVLVVPATGTAPRILLDGWFELRIPAWPTGYGRLRLSWVDFYR